MFLEHPELQSPPAGTTLWRYMDLARLLSLLEHSALWFTRLDAFEDPYEGLPTRPVIDQLWDIPAHLSTEEGARRQQVAEHNARTFTEGRLHLCVSCWHASEVESAAMRSIYGRLGEGIAVQTTFGRFRASLPDGEPDVHGGLVRYVDFETYRPSSYNLLNWATLKRSSFEHEQEFRALVLGLQHVPGVLVPVNLSSLIAAVYVSPVAPAWFSDIVARVCEKYELTAQVHQSAVLQHPAYLAERNR